MNMTKKQQKLLSLEAIESMTLEKYDVEGNDELEISVIHSADIEKFEKHLEIAGIYYYGFDGLAGNRLEVIHGRI